MKGETLEGVELDFHAPLGHNVRVMPCSSPPGKCMFMHMPEGMGNEGCLAWAPPMGVNVEGLFV